MNWQPNADQVVESWMAEGPTQLPDRVVDNILQQIDAIDQRDLLWLPGRKQMNRMLIAFGGIAAVIVLLLGGAGLYLGAPHGPAVAPTPTPTPTALTNGPLSPGRYFADVLGQRYTFSVPADGWTAMVDPSNNNYIVMKGNIYGTDFANMWPWGPTDATQPQLVWGTACQWTGTSFDPGPTVDQLATALAGLQGFRTTQPAPVTVGGYSGKELQLTVPSDAQFLNCPYGEYRSWDGRYYQKPGQTDDVRIFDAEGVRSILFTTRFVGTPSETLNEQADMLASVEVSKTPPN